ncbi:MAG: MBL fold metallo-hydrolase [Bacteroidota bacterium]|nr:MBL fold metallo-hydrolase [Bacteroidota bacterium]MXW15696.1 MBL fold metallo-hydrolase [Rhodothermaceae bacterium]MDE2646396.1 MBL fold metallo-hydrolase [Bacteroidota bacterium]MXW33631.1 MBL fold metallo-hydrolase [Rhodothermaceae bacterium]MXZ18283.1 MBL fold metallo-hydrolase [Rhodothermaceae bacterium]
MSALKFLVPGVISQEEFDAVNIEIYDVAPGVLMLVGLGGNIGVSFGEDATFMIDGQFGPLTEKIFAAVATRTDKPVLVVLNTHWHLDHVAANESLVDRGVTILAHENVRKRLSADQILPAFGQTVPARPQKALPSVTFTEDMSLHWNGDTIEIFHAPGAHTDGDTIVHFRKGNVIHMSDTYFNGMYPLIDIDCGGSIDGMIAVAEAVLVRSNESTKIIPGHGPLSNQSELEAYRDMLVTVRDTVSTLIQEGKSQEEAIAAKPTAAIDADWIDGVLEPDVFVAHVYTSLTKTTGQ